MKQIISALLVLLLLCSCGKQGEKSYTDVNLERVHTIASLVDQKNGTIYHLTSTFRSVQELHDTALCNSITEQIAQRLGAILQPVMELPNAARPIQSVELSLPLDGYEHAEVYMVQMACLSLGYTITFVIDGENTPQAAYLTLECNAVWYAFDDPQGFVEEYLADAFLPE